MKADFSNLWIAGGDFDKKMRNLRTELTLRMNGATTEQMSAEGSGYRLNYGAGLPHIAEVAGKYDFTAEECTKMWEMRIRETMIIAAMKMPHEAATPEKMLDWAASTPNGEMCNILTYHLIGKLPTAPQIAEKLAMRDMEYDRTIAYMAAGRALAADANKEAKAAAHKLCAVAADGRLWTASEAKAISFLCRQMIRKNVHDDMVASVVDEAKRQHTYHALVAAEDIATEREFNGNHCRCEEK